MNRNFSNIHNGLLRCVYMDNIRLDIDLLGNLTGVLADRPRPVGRVGGEKTLTGGAGPSLKI